MLNIKINLRSNEFRATIQHFDYLLLVSRANDERLEFENVKLKRRKA